MLRLRALGPLGLALGLLLSESTGAVDGAESEAGALAYEGSIAAAQAALASGRVSCEALVTHYLERVQAYDQPLGVRAVTAVNESVLAQARALDQKREAGEPLGPMHCVPLAVKDNMDTAGLPTTGGSAALLSVPLPTKDATLVARLRAAGALVLFKTNMAEWAFSAKESLSSSYGRTANAYDRRHTPAGSSGGTASAVAASFALAGLGTDTGNSIRGPSAHLALVGLRPTFGLVSRAGIVPLLLDRDMAGPMVRSVADAAAIMNVIAGSDPGDPTTAEADGRRAEDYAGALDAGALRGARLGVLRAFVPQETDPEVRALFEAALDDLRAAGAEIVDPLVIPDFERHLAGGRFCNRFRADVAAYLDARGGVPWRDVAARLDAFEVHPANVGRFKFFTEGPLAPPSAWEPPCPDFAEHPERQAFLAAVTNALDAAEVDALLYPSWTAVPASLSGADAEYTGDNSQRLAPGTGMPAITVPMGFTREGRLPAGLQWLGRRWDDHRLLQLAYAYEQATGHRRPPPAMPPLAP
jgi:Asp-tRNA(Asn)/Glu-tRNA(Gln) amidotransferase A subunit family amidase